MSDIEQLQDAISLNMVTIRDNVIKLTDTSLVRTNKMGIIDDESAELRAHVDELQKINDSALDVLPWLKHLNRLVVRKLKVLVNRNDDDIQLALDNIGYQIECKVGISTEGVSTNRLYLYQYHIINADECDAVRAIFRKQTNEPDLDIDRYIPLFAQLVADSLAPRLL